MGGERERRRFSREFTFEALRVVHESGRTKVKVARVSEMCPEMLCCCVREVRVDPKQSFPGNGNL